MLLTLSTTHRPATDLGHLVRKNPARAQAFELSFGTAHAFYPEAEAARCSVALLVEVDPVGLVRNRRGPAGEGGSLEQYVNDRPYAASSFLSVAIAEVFGSALAGQSKERPELVDRPLPLRATLSALPCRGGEEFLRQLFEPLGYQINAARLPLDETFPEWGESAYHRVELEATLPIHQLLSHLYVLVPVLDNDKHYWGGDDEVTKLLRHGDGWLAAHPERDAITRRYLVTDALAQLVDRCKRNASNSSTARSCIATNASPTATPPRWSRSSNISIRRAWPPSSARASGAPAPAPWCSPRPTANTTGNGKPSPPAGSATAITASNGPAPNSTTGPPASPRASATPSASFRRPRGRAGRPADSAGGVQPVKSGRKTARSRGEFSKGDFRKGRGF